MPGRRLYDLREPASKTPKPPRPYLTVCLEAFYNHLPLSLVLPEVSEDLFCIWVVLARADVAQTCLRGRFGQGAGGAWRAHLEVRTCERVSLEQRKDQGDLGV